MGSKVSTRILSRRRFLSLVGLSTGAVALGSCAPTPLPQAPVEEEAPTATAEAPAAKPAGEVIEIRVTHSWPAEQWPRQVQFDELFNEEHENIKVRGENIVWGDYVPKITAAAAAGTLPDVLYCQYAWAQRFIMDGIVISLQPFLEKDHEFWGDNGEDFVPQALVSYKWQGQLYFIPYNEGPTNLIYYNVRIFDEVGYPYPNSDKDWTLEDLLEAAKALTFGEGDKKVWGWYGLPTMGGALNADFLYVWDARWWNEPCETESHIHEDNAINCLQWWLDLRLKYKVTPMPAEVETIPGHPFGYGRVAMTKGASWDNRWIKPNLKDPYDVTHGPVGPNGKRCSASMGSGYGISRDCKHKDAAWEYLRAYTSTEGQIFNFASIGIDPARWSAWPAYFESPNVPPNAKVVWEAFKEYAVHEILDSPNGREISTTAQAIWDKAMIGEAGVKECCFQITEAVTPIMKKNEEWCRLAGLAS